MLTIFVSTKAVEKCFECRCACNCSANGNGFRIDIKPPSIEHFENEADKLFSLGLIAQF